MEENGLMLEGIYRSSGVKSKVNKLRVAFNSRTCSGVNLNDYEPAVVASVLKLVSKGGIQQPRGQGEVGGWLVKCPRFSTGGR